MNANKQPVQDQKKAHIYKTEHKAPPHPPKQEVERVAALARLELSEEEVEKLTPQLDNILRCGKAGRTGHRRCA
ncbi:MAG: aspartyl/glutamyl-tRNA amidotransferase subunit C, partial [Candidatus Electrothrix sp. MAN1_4]|nr:aspartyl/glutamyl-tRNA amidotransferase subunit C [Candidatus Electrothrix sp. MAN1_4]